MSAEDGSPHTQEEPARSASASPKAAKSSSSSGAGPDTAPLKKTTLLAILTDMTARFEQAKVCSHVARLLLIACAKCSKK